MNLSSSSSVLPRNCSSVQRNRMLAWLPSSRSTTTCSISEATLGFEACQPWLGTWMTWEEILITNPEAVPARKVVIHIPCQKYGPPWCTKTLSEFLKFCIQSKMLNTEAQTEKTRNVSVNYYKVKTETLRIVVSSPQNQISWIKENFQPFNSKEVTVHARCLKVAYGQFCTLDLRGGEFWGAPGCWNRCSSFSDELQKRP